MAEEFVAPAGSVYTSPAIFNSYPYATQSLPPAPCEQSTLIYTLAKNCTELSWNEFSIIVRSLHSYKVLERKEDEVTGTITITVGYFANVANARKRLGGAGNYISVSRLSSQIQTSELQTLQELRNKFGFGCVPEDEEPTSPNNNRSKNKRKKYATTN